ncbi:3'-5' exonuclease [Ruminococcus sp. CLA-AA-H200]|uniref:3'-5' exonuclease n=1 Tax=Ruminococcus turbiniformis TaxID=2881258 RepID=A0ABS8G0U5_9FIRM|nr:3'-5' exonuclease [Ruminococcus turbiniformis]MCC2254564.1 3'-5' exonuclease [Ruminococcus turbiniformis]
MMEWRNVDKSKMMYEFLFSKPRKVCVFDTETTGLGNDAKIIQFSGIRYSLDSSGMKAEEMLDLYLNPEEPLKEKIIEITGITDEILKHAATEQMEADTIFRFLDSADIWAAYNSPFDIRMLDQMSKRTGKRYTNHPTIDVLEMARDLIKKEDIGSHKLENVYTAVFGTSDIQFHCAIDDVKATARLMAKFLRMYHKWEPAEEKRPCHLKWASFWVNPNKPSQKRIKVSLIDGEYGDIYWDAVRLVWSCKETKKAKQLFSEIDLGSLEDQVLSRYGYRFGNAQSMKELSASWERTKNAESKKEVVTQ